MKLLIIDVDVMLITERTFFFTGDPCQLEQQSADWRGSQKGWRGRLRFLCTFGSRNGKICDTQKCLIELVSN